MCPRADNPTTVNQHDFTFVVSVSESVRQCHCQCQCVWFPMIRPGCVAVQFQTSSTSPGAALSGDITFWWLGEVTSVSLSSNPMVSVTGSAASDCKAVRLLLLREL